MDSIKGGFEQDGGAPASPSRRVSGDEVPDELHHGMCAVSDPDGEELMPLPPTEAKPTTSDSEIARNLRESRLRSSFGEDSFWS